MCSFILFAVQGDNSFFDSGIAYAQDSWKKEFEDVCSKTQYAMDLEPDALKDLVQRCDALKPVIEKLSGAQRKIYMRRLKMCRELYVFVLESKGIK
jgi:hypothetical protein